MLIKWVQMFSIPILILPEALKTRKYNFNLQIVEIITENIKSFNVVVLATDHYNFDFDLIFRKQS